MIYSNKNNRGLDFELFKKEIFEICESRIEEYNSMAFCFLLYNTEHAEIINMLNDSVYWNALDETSSNLLSFFTILSKKKQRIKANSSIRNSRQIEMMTSLISFKDIETSTLEFLNSQFQMKDKIKNPCLLFFHVDKKEIVDYILIQLHQKETEKVFNEIQFYILKSIQCLEQIDVKNKNNREEIFNLLRTDLSNSENVKWIERKLPAITTLARMVGLFS